MGNASPPAVAVGVHVEAGAPIQTQTETGLWTASPPHAEQGLVELGAGPGTLGYDVEGFEPLVAGAGGAARSGIVPLGPESRDDLDRTDGGQHVLSKQLQGGHDARPLAARGHGERRLVEAALVGALSPQGPGGHDAGHAFLAKVGLEGGELRTMIGLVEEALEARVVRHVEPGRGEGGDGTDEEEGGEEDGGEGPGQREAPEQGGMGHGGLRARVRGGGGVEG